jgi:hypothetical protein
MSVELLRTISCYCVAGVTAYRQGPMHNILMRQGKTDKNYYSSLETSCSQSTPPTIGHSHLATNSKKETDRIYERTLSTLGMLDAEHCLLVASLNDSVGDPPVSNA